MADNTVINKAATIERCVARAREEYRAAGNSFATELSHQDAAVLNIQRACEAAIDLAQHVIRRDKLGLAQSSRDAFALLANEGIISQPLAETLQKMIGYRNIAVHDYQALLLPITIAVITRHLDDFLGFSKAMLQREEI